MSLSDSYVASRCALPKGHERRGYARVFPEGEPLRVLPLAGRKADEAAYIAKGLLSPLRGPLYRSESPRRGESQRALRPQRAFSPLGIYCVLLRKKDEYNVASRCALPKGHERRGYAGRDAIYAQRAERL